MTQLLARSGAWLLLASVLIVTISPIQMRPALFASANFERFAAFAAVGFLFAYGYPQRWLAIACLVVGAAFMFEAAQLLAFGRHARAHDAVAKAAGGALGIAAGVFVGHLLELRRR